MSAKLPEGRTCRDCLHFKPKCEWLLSREGHETECDWEPSRFRPIKLSFEEIARKFEVEPGTAEFAAARKLSDGRIDRTVNELPEMMCPHCGEEFTATYEDVRHGREMPCEECERIIWIEHIELPEGSDDDGFSGPVIVTLTTEDTHPEDA